MNLATRHRDYTFLGLTQSLCPECRALVPAKIVSRAGRVYFRKRCPEHGEREDFICSDVSRYDLTATSLPAKLPKQTFVQSDKGCPFDCGLCEEHEQHTCIGVIEITDSCNLTCPMCYAASAPGQKHKSFAEVKNAIDRLVAAEGRAEVAQLSGGEPTIHPEFVEILDYALSQPIDYVMVNTNGIRLANDQGLVDVLAARRERVEVYFQLDDLDDEVLTRLRGQAGLLEKKLQALERLEQAGLNVTLVATLQGGVNPSAPARLLEFARTRPFITGLSFQPATYSGRHVLPEELEQRITFPDVIDSLCAAPGSEFTPEDFMPLPCAHPNCHWISLAARHADRLWPLSQVVDAQTNRDLLANGISFTRAGSQTLVAQLLSRLACGESGCCTPITSELLSSTCCPAPPAASSLPVLSTVSTETSEATPTSVVLGLLAQALEGQASARDLLRITVTSFLDMYNFDVRRVMKCCTHHVLPSGHIIPFCAYNVLYRDGKVPLPKLD
ncbi:MAG: radical SAM protein [Pirellulaceae bacterium]|nr:radical SAM protein [Pirellulaceae bacterium]